MVVIWQVWPSALDLLGGVVLMAALDADEDDDSIAAIYGSLTSCGSGSTQRAAKFTS
jgi:hypothetical protein